MPKSKIPAQKIPLRTPKQEESMIRRRVKFLAALKSPRKVLEFFLRRCCYGDQCESVTCPTAVYLKRGITHYSVTVGGELISCSGCGYAEGFGITTPRSVDRFISTFDGGHVPCYRKLIIKD